MDIPSPKPRARALSVSELNHQVRHLLEVSFLQVWVEGEISSFSRPASGHWYFTLKDAKSQVKCAMFRGNNQRVRTPPKEGDQVLVRGKVTLYENRGDYQIIAEAMEPAGLGALQQAFDALKLKLQSEGMFDAERKKPVPTLPKHIGVITSATGAAIHDILTVLKRRCPGIPVTLYPASVQGNAAAGEIVNAIQAAERHGVVDVLIIGRGGGSLEDLWPFNEEKVARAIAACSLPTVSAVGHEVDFSIADFVADFRAPTPSAAAEHLAPDQSAWIRTLEQQSSRLEGITRRLLARLQEQVSGLGGRLRDPRRELQNHHQRLDDLESRLKSSFAQQLQARSQTLSQQQVRLANQSPRRQLADSRNRVSQLKEQLFRELHWQLNEQRDRLGHAAQSLQLVSPLATLGRGYAIVSTRRQPVIRDASRLKPGDEINARLGHGNIDATVTAIHSSLLPSDDDIEPS
ncbi:exodeoxyribonuclease VII large subunit [Marinobacter sp. BGYM27]|uniref:exodeoxyribonuclease VII large subunit n=1 Tax=Marinobacter sp. BGYM27 TaxID=2975597 RepID=UPI0021A8C9B2|nr:exodeoxyribonuclease VII large subunit [Marinobacter sp. BGYM27]MDG5498890.1 exodeoxyribonuclease VII large subunit [Marinobacter sp. BGYM27]